MGQAGGDAVADGEDLDRTEKTKTQQKVGDKDG